MALDEKVISDKIDHLFRYEYGKLVSVLTKTFGTSNIELAEDVVQEAMLEAMKPEIKHIFSICRITKLSCNENDSENGKFKFIVSVGEVPNNGSIYYLDINANLEDTIAMKHKMYLKSFGFTI